MTGQVLKFKDSRATGALDLTNVRIAMRAMEEATEPGAEPGLHLFYGESGWGKTVAVTACTVDYNAVYVEAIAGMTPKALVAEILGELGETDLRGTLVDLIKRTSDRLLMTGRIVIIDEADCLRNIGLLEAVRSIFNLSQATILLVGEEHLDRRLKQHEKFHNRIIGFHAAQPCTIEDAGKLAGYYAAGITVADDLVERVVIETRGVTRRVRTNFVNMRKRAMLDGTDAIDLDWWMQQADAQGRPLGFFTGDKPERA